jgi:hypothetical protein
MKFEPLVALLALDAFAGNTVTAQQIPLVDTYNTLQSPYWYETITHNGEASFMQPSCKSSYQVFRNVVSDFGADNTGKVDASMAIQDAIDGKTP